MNDESIIINILRQVNGLKLPVPSVSLLSSVPLLRLSSITISQNLSCIFFEKV